MDYAEVNLIRTQFQAGLWPQFLQMVRIEGLRGWSGQAVEFSYPVVAIVGGERQRQKHVDEGRRVGLRQQS